MDSLLVDDDARGLKRNTGVSGCQWVFYVLKQLEYNTIAYKERTLQDEC